MFKKILYPIDLSEISVAVMSKVLSIAEKYDSEIHVIYVARDMTYFAELDVPHPSIYSFSQDVKKGAEQKMKTFCEKNLLFQGASCEVLIGDPSTEIVNYVEDHDIDLVVMATQGRKGLNRLVFGSVAARVVRNGPVPVLTIKPTPKEE